MVLRTDCLVCQRHFDVHEDYLAHWTALHASRPDASQSSSSFSSSSSASCRHGSDPRPRDDHGATPPQGPIAADEDDNSTATSASSGRSWAAVAAKAAATETTAGANRDDAGRHGRRPMIVAGAGLESASRGRTSYSKHLAASIAGTGAHTATAPLASSPRRSSSRTLRTHVGVGRRETFDRGEVMLVDEDRFHEFKAVQNTRDPVWGTLRHCGKIVTGFLNSAGGCAVFGVEDSGEVKGIALSRADRDTVRIGLNNIVAGISPAVPPAMVAIDFPRVLCGNAGTVSAAGPLCLVRIVVGDYSAWLGAEGLRIAPLFTTADGRAYERRDGSTHVVDPLSRHIHAAFPTVPGTNPAAVSASGSASSFVPSINAQPFVPSTAKPPQGWSPRTRNPGMAFRRVNVTVEEVDPDAVPGTEAAGAGNAQVHAGIGSEGGSHDLASPGDVVMEAGTPPLAHDQDQTPKDPKKKEVQQQPTQPKKKKKKRKLAPKPPLLIIPPSPLTFVEVHSEDATPPAKTFGATLASVAADLFLMGPAPASTPNLRWSDGHDSEANLCTPLLATPPEVLSAGSALSGSDPAGAFEAAAASLELSRSSVSTALVSRTASSQRSKIDIVLAPSCRAAREKFAEAVPAAFPPTTAAASTCYQAVVEVRVPCSLWRRGLRYDGLEVTGSVVDPAAQFEVGDEVVVGSGDNVVVGRVSRVSGLRFTVLARLPSAGGIILAGDPVARASDSAACVGSSSPHYATSPLASVGVAGRACLLLLVILALIAVVGAAGFHVMGRGFDGSVGVGAGSLLGGGSAGGPCVSPIDLAASGGGGGGAAGDLGM